MNRADALVVHKCRDGRVVILEYEVFGRVVASDAIAPKFAESRNK